MGLLVFRGFLETIIQLNDVLATPLPTYLRQAVQDKRRGSRKEKLCSRVETSIWLSGSYWDGCRADASTEKGKKALVVDAQLSKGPVLCSQSFSEMLHLSPSHLQHLNSNLMSSQLSLDSKPQHPFHALESKLLEIATEVQVGGLVDLIHLVSVNVEAPQVITHYYLAFHYGRAF
ncbi:hypothetical protein LZ554_008322 [Drepanopeziza brunnea f. sp. 'monogermtubi']|nr:hypothetical protein LZ554_008322 [Drepanopeziza brunnea f. sp. 'monogermtubi']